MTPEAFHEVAKFGRSDGFEDVITAIYREIVAVGDLAVDCGANIGRHTFPLAEVVGASGQVIAIEAIPELAERLTAATAKLPWVQIVNGAVSNRLGTTSFNFVRNITGLSGIKPRDYGGNDVDLHLIEVNKVRLNELLADSGRRWSFMKLDLEGGEFDAMEGGRRVISAHRPLIIFENGRDRSAHFYGYTRDDFFAFFDDLAYSVFDLLGGRFRQADWSNPSLPWYFIAAPRGSHTEQFVLSRVPEIFRTIGREQGFSIPDTLS